MLALFLISTAWQYRMGVRPRSFSMRLPWFVPVSFASGLTSAVVGASGLLVNPFYLNYGLMKEAMLATRAANSLGDPAREDRRLRDVRRCCIGGWRGTDWWPVPVRSPQSGWSTLGCGVSRHFAFVSSPCSSCCSVGC